MGLTGIGDARTPGRPIEETFDADTTEPSANQEVLLIGHKHATSGTVAAYTPVNINNSGDAAAALTEAVGYFGAGCELVKMVQAAIKANEGGAVFPQLKCVALASTDTDFGASNAALVAAEKVKQEFTVSPYASSNSTMRSALRDHARKLSGATRVANNQFGTFGVVGEHVTAVGSLPVVDSQFMIAYYLRDSQSRAYSVGEFAAACAAFQAANPAPFNPLNGLVVQGVLKPTLVADNLTIGDAEESETVLQAGFTPLKVLANDDVAFVRTITTRKSADGSGTPVVSSYYDVQDFQCLHLYRKALYTRYAQPDFNVKASKETAQKLLSEGIRIAKSFEDQGMFQAVDQLAKFFKVQRSTTDRHTFEFKYPVNVVPGLHRVKGNVVATVQFDTLVL